MARRAAAWSAEPAPRRRDAANRMRASSTRRRWPPDSVRSGWVRTRSGRPRLAQMRPASLSARVPAERGEPLLELAVAAHRPVAGGVVGDLGHQRLLLFQVGQQGVEAAGGQHPVAGQRSRGCPLWDPVADNRFPRCGRWCPRTARPRLPGCAWSWSCRRRCARRARCGRRAAPATPHRRWRAACALRRGPRGPLR